MFFYEVCEAFRANKISYAVVGGYALALHGVVRATINIDFVLRLKQADFEKAEKALNELGLKSRIPVRPQDIIKMREEYIEKRNLIAWSFVDYQDPTRQVDILITEDVDDFEVEVISFAGYKINVVSLKDLLKMKQKSARPQDLIDIENIKAKLKG